MKSKSDTHARPLLTPEDERKAIEEFYKKNKVIHKDCKERYGETALTRLSC